MKLWLACLLLLGACRHRPPSASELLHFQADLMHTRWDMQFVGANATETKRLGLGASRIVEDLDLRLALWKPQSELARVNAAAGSAQSVTLSAGLARCLGLALKAAEESRGALDPTVGPLTRAWWQARQEKRLLRPDELKALRSRQGLAHVRMTDAPQPSVDLGLPGMELDLGAIAKGFAQDRVAEWLATQGVKAFLLNAGGQVYAKGRKPDGGPWRVGIEHPRDPARIAAVLELEDAVLSTSGDYEQVSVIEGKRVHHILDPRTGFSVQGMASVSVLMPLGADAGARADAASTAAFVLGAERGMKFLSARGMDALFIAEGRDGLHALRSPAWKNLDVVLNEP